MPFGPGDTQGSFVENLSLCAYQFRLIKRSADSCMEPASIFPEVVSVQLLRFPGSGAGHQDKDENALALQLFRIRCTFLCAPFAA